MRHKINRDRQKEGGQILPIRSNESSCQEPAPAWPDTEKAHTHARTDTRRFSRQPTQESVCVLSLAAAVTGAASERHITLLQSARRTSVLGAVHFRIHVCSGKTGLYSQWEVFQVYQMVHNDGHCSKALCEWSYKTTHRPFKRPLNQQSISCLLPGCPQHGALTSARGWFKSQMRRDPCCYFIPSSERQWWEEHEHTHTHTQTHI